MSRAYLETLADLPWSALAGQRTLLPANVSSKDDTPDGGPDKEDGNSSRATAGSEPGTTGPASDGASAPHSVSSTPAGACHLSPSQSLFESQATSRLQRVDCCGVA